MHGYHPTRHTPHVEIFKRKDKLWDWRLVAGNGEEICGSLQGYTDKWAAKEAYNTALGLLDTNPEVRYKSTGR